MTEKAEKWAIRIFAASNVTWEKCYLIFLKVTPGKK